MSPVLIAALVGCAAGAETAGAPPALEEILITAQRRSENLQDIPLAATVITGDQLEGRAVFRLADLHRVTCAIHIRRSLKLGSPQYSAEEARIIEERRRPEPQLGLALQIGFLRPSPPSSESGPLRCYAARRAGSGAD